MKEFNYTINDPNGIHARPAGVLVKEVKGFESAITVWKGDASCDMKKLMKLMGMGIKQGDTITIKVEGPDEDAAVEAVKKAFEENF